MTLYTSKILILLLNIPLEITIFLFFVGPADNIDRLAGQPT